MDASEQTRKRLLDSSGREERTAKKACHGSNSNPEPLRKAPAAAKEVYREEIRQLHCCYNQLNQVEDILNSAWPEAFAKLLSACEGSGAARRLAARLLPRLAHRSPGQTSEVISGLAKLLVRSCSSDPLHKQTLVDALRGATQLCCQSIESEVLSRLVTSLLRVYHTHGSTAVRREDGHSQPEGEVDSLQELAGLALQAAFDACPQTFLQSSINALLDQDGQLRSAASHVLVKQLVEAHPPSPKDSAINGKFSIRKGALAQDSVQQWALQRMEELVTGGCEDGSHLAQQCLTRIAEQGPRPGSTGPELGEVPASAEDLRSAQQAQARESAVSRGDRPRSGRQPSQSSGGSRSWGSSPRPSNRQPRAGDSRQLSPGEVVMERGSEPALPMPGGSMCIASSCLWLANVPRHVSPLKLRQLCEMFGSVQSLDFPPCLNMDEALVTFATIGQAVEAYESLCGKEEFARGLPLEVQFCKAAPQRPELCDLWVASSPGLQQVDDVLDVLQRAGPQQSARRAMAVSGPCPGTMVQMPSRHAAAAAMDVLDQHMSRAARQGWGFSASLRRRLSEPLPPFASRTLWVGQVRPEITDYELVALMRQFGEVTNHRIMRRSCCAFIDFASADQAAAARNELGRGGVGGGCAGIIVEFKNEQAWRQSHPPSPPMRQTARGGQLSPGSSWTRGRGAMSPDRETGSGRPPLARWDNVRSAPGSGWDTPSHQLAGTPHSWGTRSAVSGFPTSASSQRSNGWHSGHGTASASPPPRADRRTPPNRQAASPGATIGTRAGAPGTLKRGRAETPSDLPSKRPLRRFTDHPEPRTIPEAAPTAPIKAASVSKEASPPLPPPPPPANAPIKSSPGSQQPATHRAPSCQADGGHHRGPQAGSPHQADRQLPAAQPHSGTPEVAEMDVESDGELPANKLPLQNGIPYKAVTAPMPDVPKDSSASQKLQASSQPQPTWQGLLAKSGAVLCELFSEDWPVSSTSGGEGYQAQAWPSTLNVQSRLSVEYLDLHLPPRTSQLPPLRRLMLCKGATESQRRAFVEFLQSLADRRRMGVIHLSSGIPKHKLWLVPASASITKRLQISWEPRELLIALVVLEGK